MLEATFGIIYPLALLRVLQYGESSPLAFVRFYASIYFVIPLLIV